MGTMDDPCILELRPQVTMRHITAVPHVVALGVCSVLPNMAIGWPHRLVSAATGSMISELRAHAGYDEGMFVRVELDFLADVDNADEVVSAITQAVDNWAAALEGRPALGPLAPVIEAYAEHLYGLGDRVRVTYPNGRPYAQGTFAGIDVWGRATVRLDNGQELEFPPEQFAIAW